MELIRISLLLLLFCLLNDIDAWHNRQRENNSQRPTEERWKNRQVKQRENRWPVFNTNNRPNRNFNQGNRNSQTGYQTQKANNGRHNFQNNNRQPVRENRWPVFETNRRPNRNSNQGNRNLQNGDRTNQATNDRQNYQNNHRQQIQHGFNSKPQRQNGQKFIRNQTEVQFRQPQLTNGPPRTFRRPKMQTGGWRPISNFTQNGGGWGSGSGNQMPERASGNGGTGQNRPQRGYGRTWQSNPNESGTGRQLENELQYQTQGMSVSRPKSSYGGRQFGNNHQGSSQYNQGNKVKITQQLPGLQNNNNQREVVSMETEKLRGQVYSQNVVNRVVNKPLMVTPNPIAEPQENSAPMIGRENNFQNNFRPLNVELVPEPLAKPEEEITPPPSGLQKQANLDNQIIRLSNEKDEPQMTNKSSRNEEAIQQIVVNMPDRQQQLENNLGNAGMFKVQEEVKSSVKEQELIEDNLARPHMAEEPINQVHANMPVQMQQFSNNIKNSISNIEEKEMAKDLQEFNGSNMAEQINEELTNGPAQEQTIQDSLSSNGPSDVRGEIKALEEPQGSIRPILVEEPKNEEMDNKPVQEQLFSNNVGFSNFQPQMEETKKQQGMEEVSMNPTMAQEPLKQVVENWPVEEQQFQANFGSGNVQNADQAQNQQQRWYQNSYETDKMIQTGPNQNNAPMQLPVVEVSKVGPQTFNDQQQNNGWDNQNGVKNIESSQGMYGNDQNYEMTVGITPTWGNARFEESFNRNTNRFGNYRNNNMQRQMNNNQRWPQTDNNQRWVQQSGTRDTLGNEEWPEQQQFQRGWNMPGENQQQMTYGSQSLGNENSQIQEAVTESQNIPSDSIGRPEQEQGQKLPGQIVENDRNETIESNLDDLGTNGQAMKLPENLEFIPLGNQEQNGSPNNKFSGNYDNQRTGKSRSSSKDKKKSSRWPNLQDNWVRVQQPNSWRSSRPMNRDRFGRWTNQRKMHFQETAQMSGNNNYQGQASDNQEIMMNNKTDIQLDVSTNTKPLMSPNCDTERVPVNSTVLQYTAYDIHKKNEDGIPETVTRNITVQPKIHYYILYKQLHKKNETVNK